MVFKLLVCVIHSKKLELRMPSLNSTLSKLQGMRGYDVTVKTITNHETDNIDVNVVRSKMLLENPKTNTIFDSLVKNIHIKQVSQVFKHVDALKSFADDKSYDALLVLEDDVLSPPSLAHDFNTLVQYIKNANKDVDILVTGAPTPKLAESNSAPAIPLFQHFRFIPTVDSYIVTRKGIDKIVDNFFPIRYQMNVHLSYVAMTQNLNVMLASPNVFVNGSKFGVYLSSTDPNNKLFMNQDYNKMMMINSKAEIDNNDKNAVETIMKTASFKEHPDFQYQFAVWYTKQNEHKKAKEIFDTVYKAYIDNECILSNESEFLMNYTRVFKHLQD